ncbi:hypothetical protein [Microlunatus flavus]|uniref:Uncharacterized protein n=1 Tax=Microlunatus flavus TaxID=1036181 RepID=A0A1H9N5C0_9ACTN|nr:hypothetical protein [Microlunatus flavus]SER30967.1 hypothetical protein SAMN05421756_11299 [Microlunatus flavus]
MSSLLGTTHPPLATGVSSRRSTRGLAAAAVVGLLAAAAGALPASAAPGDQSADTTVANVAVSSAITLQGLTPSFTLTGLPGDTVAELSAVAYTVLTNNVGGYNVTVQADAPALTPAGTSADTIPVSNLAVRPSGSGGAYTAVSATSPITLHGSGTRSDVEGDDYADDYQIDIPFVADDTYSVTLNYIATAS